MPAKNRFKSRKLSKHEEAHAALAIIIILAALAALAFTASLQTPPAGEGGSEAIGAAGKFTVLVGSENVRTGQVVVNHLDQSTVQVNLPGAQPGSTAYYGPNFIAVLVRVPDSASDPPFALVSIPALVSESDLKIGSNPPVTFVYTLESNQNARLNLQVVLQ